MKVLVATRETNGRVPGDYCWTVDDELVRLPLGECDDVACGCNRGFAGVTSHRATTTAMVVERPEVTPALLAEILRDDAIASGFPDDFPELEAVLRSELAALEIICRQWTEGAVIERRGDLVRLRAWIAVHDGAL